MDQFVDQVEDPIDMPGPVVAWWIPLREPMRIETTGELVYVLPRYAEELAAQSTEVLPSNVWIVVRIRFHSTPAVWQPTSQQVHAFELAKNQLWEPLTENGTKDGFTDLWHFVAELEVTFHRDSLPDLDERSAAFEAALEKLQRVQDSYALITGTAPAALTLETLPELIPIETRGINEPAVQELYCPNFNVPGLGDEVEAPVSCEVLKQLDFQVGGAFWSYHAHRKQALGALAKEGDYNKALISAATAAELLFDELLRALLWENNWDPEHAARQYFSGHENATALKRLKRHFAALLDYDWDPSTCVTLQKWRVGLASPRNWALHNGSRVPRAIAEQAIEALLELDAMVGARVAQNVEAYPRVAHLLLGGEGMRNMGVWSQDIHDRVSSEREVVWHPTFSRWRDATVRAAANLEGLEPTPSLDRALLHVVFEPHRRRWVLLDELANYATPVKENPDYLSQEQQEWMEKLSAEPVAHGTVVAMSGHGLRKWATRGNGWQRPYKLLPTLGVMRDGSDGANKFITPETQGGS